MVRWVQSCGFVCSYSFISYFKSLCLTSPFSSYSCRWESHLCLPVRHDASQTSTLSGSSGRLGCRPCWVYCLVPSVTSDKFLLPTVISEQRVDSTVASRQISSSSVWQFLSKSWEKMGIRNRAQPCDTLLCWHLKALLEYLFNSTLWIPRFYASKHSESQPFSWCACCVTTKSHIRMHVHCVLYSVCIQSFTLQKINAYTSTMWLKCY